MRRTLLIVGGGLLVLYLLTGVTQIQPGERAVVRRFGRVLDETPGPGLWISLPWGMDRVDRVSVDALRHVAIGQLPAAAESGAAPAGGQYLTGDHNLVNVRIIIGYEVRKDGVVDYVLQQDRVDGVVARTAEAALAEWLAGREIDAILLRGKAELSRDLVPAIQRRLDPCGLGVEVRQADVAVLFPPEEVKSAFDDVTRAQAQVRTQLHQAEQEAERRRREAEAEKYRIEQLTTAYVGEQQLRARADAGAFTARLEQYRQLRQTNPDYLRGLWLAEVGKLYTRLKENGQLDLLDHHLSTDGLDLTLIKPPPGKK